MSRTAAGGGAGAITQVAGIEVGHFSDARRPTGCTVIIAKDGAVGGVDVRGAAPGTRETDLLQPGNLVERVHAIVLAGGSAWGLEAATGAVRWLEEQGVGYDVGVGRLPLVPSAVLFDLMMGDASIRPDAQAGYLACTAASNRRPTEGNVGAGSGASVGKLFGMARAMKGGVGTASITLDGVTVGALIACNAVGDVLDANTGRILAGARTTARGLKLMDSRRAMLGGKMAAPLLAGTNTTIGVIATDAVISKAQAQRLALMGHDGLARTINPVHTQLDGDTLFTLGTGKSKKTLSLLLLGTMAAEVTARATMRAVLAAKSVSIGKLTLPSATDLAASQA